MKSKILIVALLFIATASFAKGEKTDSTSAKTAQVAPTEITLKVNEKEFGQVYESVRLSQTISAFESQVLLGKIYKQYQDQQPKDTTSSQLKK